MSQTRLLSGPTSASPITPHDLTDALGEWLGADLLEFLNATNERAADGFRHVHT